MGSRPRAAAAQREVLKRPAAALKRPAAASTMKRRPAAAATAASKKRPAAATAARKRPAAAVVRKKPAAQKRPAAAKVKRPPAASRGAKGGRLKPLSCVGIAEQAYNTYFQDCNFPVWSMQHLADGKLEEYAKSVVVYHSDQDDLTTVQRVATLREPANIGMVRCYDEDMFEASFGYRHGAYEESDEAALMPNIAVFCRTPMLSAEGEWADVNVINVIGYGFDSEDQPDYKYFMPLHDNPAKWSELVQRMKLLWRYIFECAKRHQFKRVYLADVGGGNFGAGLEVYEATSYAKLKEESLVPIQEEYADCVESHRLERVPDWCFSAQGGPLLKDSLLVNAWDPWSLVGNGNFADNSLDGFFGRCTAMALLCWPRTNPHLRYESVSTEASRVKG